MERARVALTRTVAGVGSLEHCRAVAEQQLTEAILEKLAYSRIQHDMPIPTQGSQARCTETGEPHACEAAAQEPADLQVILDGQLEVLHGASDALRLLEREGPVDQEARQRAGNHPAFTLEQKAAQALRTVSLAPVLLLRFGEV